MRTSSRHEFITRPMAILWKSIIWLKLTDFYYLRLRLRLSLLWTKMTRLFPYLVQRCRWKRRSTHCYLHDDEIHVISYDEETLEWEYCCISVHSSSNFTILCSHSVKLNNQINLYTHLFYTIIDSSFIFRQKISRSY
jgi:hypothetical protein